MTVLNPLPVRMQIIKRYDVLLIQEIRDKTGQVVPELLNRLEG